jgi:hypothetical protein
MSDDGKMRASILKLPNVRFWHKADILVATRNVRFRG